MAARTMSKQAEPSKRCILMARILLCLIGPLCVYIGMARAIREYGSGVALVFDIYGIALGLYMLFVAIFGPGSTAVRVLASLMEPD
jgi:hypothetical protein